MGAPTPPKEIPKCGDKLPKQSQWTHDDKVKYAKISKEHQNKRKPEDYENFFKLAVEPLNQLASALQLADVNFLLALAANESSWLNAENTWLNNLFGLTAGGHDNLGFDSLQQCADYWQCRFGPYVSKVQNLADFVEGLKNAQYNPNTEYYALKKWNEMVASINSRYGKFGYERVSEKGTWILKKKG